MVHPAGRIINGTFQSTLPRRERLRTEHYGIFLLIFQSTLPRRERRKKYISLLQQYVISIHAPAKGATSTVRVFLMQAVRFQSTLPRRERPSSVTRACPCWNFNPRSREGSDRSPARLRPIYSYFNPRSREGSDNAQVDFFCGKQDFNPRSREGSDPLPCLLFHSAGHFNPRSREGSDSSSPLSGAKHCGFQSTLPRRERRLRSAALECLIRFQSTLPRRERRIQTNQKTQPYRFQSTLPRRERPSSGVTPHRPAPFQSTLPRRERHRQVYTFPLLYHNFNPRSREGSDTPCAVKRSAEKYFNPRSREGSDLCNVQLTSNKTGNFNPRSREGSDTKSVAKVMVMIISIHAPAKGATLHSADA